MIKKNIAFCYTIFLVVGLVAFKQLMYKKEFSKVKFTKLISKGFSSPLFNINIWHNVTLGQASFSKGITNYRARSIYYYYVGLLYFILENIAIKIYKDIVAPADQANPELESIILLSNNGESKIANLYTNGYLAFSSWQSPLAKPVSRKSAISTTEFNKQPLAKPALAGEGVDTLPNQPKSKLIDPQGKNLNEIESLKPLLFNYLITKNNQNGIGLDLKNSKLTNLVTSPFQGLVLQKEKIKLGNNSYNFMAKTSSTEGNTFSISAAGEALNNKLLPLGLGAVIEKKNWYLSEDLIKLISAFFKSIYCLISKPKFINTPDKIIIEILYFITIPDYKIFKWYNFLANEKAGASIESANINTNDSQSIKKNTAIFFPGGNRSLLILKKNNLVKKTLFNLNNTNITKLYFNKFIILFKLLSSYFKKPIEFNLIRLHKSNYDSNILAQLFYLILKRKNIRSAIHNLYTKNKFSSARAADNGKEEDLNNYGIACPAYISGLYIHIGGRLMREPIIPRKTTKKFEKGAIATGKVNFVDTARITKKNKKGAYTIKIAFAQNFMFTPQA